VDKAARADSAAVEGPPDWVRSYHLIVLVGVALGLLAKARRLVIAALSMDFGMFLCFTIFVLDRSYITVEERRVIAELAAKVPLELAV
jgi:hypothetical protein